MSLTPSEASSRLPSSGKPAMTAIHQFLFTTTGIGGLIALLLCLYYLFRKPKPCYSNNNRSINGGHKLMAPEPGGAWPLMGHVHLLRPWRSLAHFKLAAISDKLGPVFTIRLGFRRALVVSSSEAAKECLGSNDRVFATRPSSIPVKLMGYNYALFGFTQYGPYWRELRKIAMTELLSNKRLELLKNNWTSEIDTSIKELYEEWKVNKAKRGEVAAVVEMKQWFVDLTLNVAVKMVVGKRYFGKSVACDQEESRRCQKAFRDFLLLVGVFMVGDAVPFLGWLEFGYLRKMKNTARDLDLILEKWLEEHKGKIKITASGGDFMDVMLSILEESKICGIDADTIVKATCMNLLTAATDSTMITLTWALSLLLNNRPSLKRAQDELDAHVGKERHVEESDVNSLVYMQAIVKETLRLYPPEPLSGPREAMEDCVVAGYHVPAGTRLIVNLWKIQRDPSTWPDRPTEFWPERFLTTHKDRDVWGQHFELIPFGSGRRSCPAIAFVLQLVPLVLARLLHGFELATVGGAPMDMTETEGLTNIKATPLEVEITPRLSPNLFES